MGVASQTIRQLRRKGVRTANSLKGIDSSRRHVTQTTTALASDLAEIPHRPRSSPTVSIVIIAQRTQRMLTTCVLQSDGFARWLDP